MNIENNTYNAKNCLDKASERIETHDYDTALALLAKAYSSIREAIDQVASLKALKSEVEQPAGENTG